MERGDKKAAQISAVVYTLISLGVTLIFITIATLSRKYTSVEIYGGAGWVFLLSMIVTMPTVTPWIKKRLKGGVGLN